MDTQQPIQPSSGVPEVRPMPRPRKDRRWLTLVIMLLLIPLITLMRLWPLFATFRSIQGVATYENLVRDHQEGAIAYAQNPPVGGPHSVTWQNCGIYDQTIPNEQAVHSLEHGAVWLTYRPDLPAADIRLLHDLARGQNYVLLSPYPNQPAPVVATAWGVQLLANGASDSRLERFLIKYVQGTQTPEPGGLCSGGGAGQPVAR